MNRGLRPVDAVVFAFHLVLLVLAGVGGVRTRVWLLALGLSVVFGGPQVMEAA